MNFCYYDHSTFQWRDAGFIMQKTEERNKILHDPKRKFTHWHNQTAAPLASLLDEHGGAAPALPPSLTLPIFCVTSPCRTANKWLLESDSPSVVSYRHPPPVLKPMRRRNMCTFTSCRFRWDLSNCKTCLFVDVVYQCLLLTWVNPNSLWQRLRRPRRDTHALTLQTSQVTHYVTDGIERPHTNTG